MVKNPSNTPMMRQYCKIKSQYKDAFLFYRLGDFYEMFYQDAIEGAHILELTLTSRNRNSKKAIPMCGIPHAEIMYYARELTQKGYKVAICNQMQNPQDVKGMVKRAVVRVITPGTYTEINQDDATKTNYLVALDYSSLYHTYSLAYAELSTGELKTTKLKDMHQVINEILGLHTKEIITDASNSKNQIPTKLLKIFNKKGIMISHQKNISLRPTIKYLIKPLQSNLERIVTARLLTYIYVTQKRDLSNLKQVVPYKLNQYMKLSYNTKYNLELMHNIRTHKKVGTLLWVLDKTQNSMGGRKLKQWLQRPLVNLNHIHQRQEAVKELINHPYEQQKITELLSKMYDLSHLASKIAYGSVNGKDLINLLHSLNQVPSIKRILARLSKKSFGKLYNHLNSVFPIRELITEAIVSNPPTSVTDGGLIKHGYNPQLDTYKDAMNNGHKWMRNLQKHERKVTGINNLKVGMNHVFGYYIEVTKANLNKVPKNRYQRRQTLTNSERFSTSELKKHEALIIEAQTHSKDLEYKLFVKIRKAVEEYIKPIQQTAEVVASLDVLQSFANVSTQYNWTRPILVHSRNMKIINGRHPVVERAMGNHYVPNDIIMNKDTQIQLITGPNMSGKSTYMRQLALIVILAQIGCFVPAQSATIPVFDQIFTRIGASDDLMAGQSTFMVEMKEANNALQHATPNSLILFDELGRGTATYDGMSLAKAIIKYIHNHIHAKTLFSTHYHGLTNLAKQLPHLENVHIGSKVKNGNLIFTHKIEKGSESKSYGIHVAKLAGLPASVLKDANVILKKLSNKKNSFDESNNSELADAKFTIKKLNDLNSRLFAIKNKQDKLLNNRKTVIDRRSNPVSQIDNDIISKLKKIDLMSITPLDAMNDLYQLKAVITKNKVNSKIK